MAEDHEIPGADIPGESQDGDPAALSLAFDIAEHDPGVAAEAAAYLKTQRRLAALQYKYTADKEHFEVSHLRWRRFTEQMKGLLQIMTAMMGAGFAIALGVMIWNASRSNGLVIEPFAVAPELAARGLSGEVVAGQMLDDLTAMQDATDSARPAQSYENNWGSDVKVEIPETSISISELYRFLRAHLGHDTLITGAVWRTPTGIAVTAREGAERGAVFTGAENDLDRLMQQAAEHVYSVTQPFRYANYLDRDYAAPDIAARSDQAAAIYRRLIAGGSDVEKAWAWYGLGTIEFRVTRDYHMAVRYFQNAIAANPDFTLGYTALASRDRDLGRLEESLSAWVQAKRLLGRSSVPDINPRQLALRRLQDKGGLGVSLGDYGEALASARLGADAPEYFANLDRGSTLATGLVALAYLHDGGGMRAWLRELGMIPDMQGFGINPAFGAARALENWPAVLQLERTMPEDIRQRVVRNELINLATIALAHAHLGDIAGAERLIAATPADCYDCLVARADIAEIRGEHARADFWFARAASQGPSIPFAHEDWGRALLDRSKPDDAIAKFTLSSQKGPHFADPLEGWGEALMAKNQSHLALAKFAEAEKYTPNWGRLHLKWGEALVWAGKPDEGKKQFARAVELDLTSAEKAELARQP